MTRRATEQSVATTVAALARDAMTQGLEELAAARSSGKSNRSALRWLDRAHRLVPHDPNATLTLASACLARDPARAATLFQTIADTYDIRQAWLGLAAARLRLGGPDEAAGPLAALLSRHAFQPDAAAMAEVIGRESGWCALRADGILEVHAGTGRSKPAILLDGVPLAGAPLRGGPVRGARLPSGWQHGRSIEVCSGDVPLLGSPIDITAIRRLAGCVETRDGGIEGWAWHPGDPDTAPELTLLDAAGRLLRRFVAESESIMIADTGPLARPRSFRLTRGELDRAAAAGLAGPLRIVGPDGKDLPGSPLDPSLDETAHIAAARRLGQIFPAATAVKGSQSPNGPAAAVPALRADGPVPPQPVGADGKRRAVSIVIPVHDGGEAVAACIDSVLNSVPAATRIIIVDDGSSDPKVVRALDCLVRPRRIVLLRHNEARGFPAAANAGITAAGGHDVVLLNSDTLVPSGWLERLREAAYGSRDIGTVTPLSNDASILSYPATTGSNRVPDQFETNRLDHAARKANGGAVIDIPVGVGFCIYLRRDCLNATGSFRAEWFAQGYGEENDFCLRARRLGWRSVALTGLFVGHRGSTSFGGSAAHLRARNSRIVEQLHPGYHALIQAFLARDPLAAARRSIDLCRWSDHARKSKQRNGAAQLQRSAVLITHNDGGGVEQRLIHAIRQHRQSGRRVIVLRPAETAAGEAAVKVQDGDGEDFPNLIYAIPSEMPALLRLLRAANPELIEAHHLAEYPAAIYDLITALDRPYDVHVHDYAWFCPRVSLVGANDRYCGEPDLPDCEACIADHGHFLKQDMTVAALRERSAAFLARAHRVVVPSNDTGLRMRRHFDGLITQTFPHEDDAAIPPPAGPPMPGHRRTGGLRRRDVQTIDAELGDAAASGAGRLGVAERRISERRKGSRTSICVVGGIGVHKGYDILLACARDAARRDLDLQFIVVGHTIDDARMLATGRVFITGRFEPDEAVSLIAEQHARLGFVASICPETWCLSLGDIWRAGLPAAAFDIGAPAERIRSTGRGILLPLGLSASAINNALVAVAWKMADQ